MKKIVFVLLAFFLCVGPIAGKKYKFVYNPPFEVEQVATGQNYTRLVKSWAVDKNADKAIIKAKQNAIAAVLFTGLPRNAVVPIPESPPLCQFDKNAYNTHKQYFDKFFTEGEFLNYVVDVNSTYPTGQDNIQTPEGRRVGVLLQIHRDDLEKRLIQDNIINKKGEQYNY